MTQYIKTDTVLDKILANTVVEIAQRRDRIAIADVRQQADSMPIPPSFAQALRRETVALIAEVKKASPSKGVLIADFDPLALATTYANNGASAISVLTDEKFFQGHLDYLRLISAEVSIPTLRKDFVIDPYQVYEARAVGASAVLLIVAALEDAQMRDLLQLIQSLNMTALVEVHDEAELDRALAIGASVIGVNNRDLKSFHVDLGITERIAKQVPESVTLVAESGLKTADDVAHMGAIGAHAVLIGEGLVTSGDIATTVRLFSEQKRG